MAFGGTLVPPATVDVMIEVIKTQTTQSKVNIKFLKIRFFLFHSNYCLRRLTVTRFFFFCGRLFRFFKVDDGFRFLGRALLLYGQCCSVNITGISMDSDCQKSVISYQMSNLFSSVCLCVELN